MLKLKAFLKRHLLWVGLLAVTAPLLTILVLQYRSLATLEWSLPVARKNWMRNYLEEVSQKVEDFYKTNAERVLDVPATAFAHGQSEENYAGKAVAHFEKNEFKGAKRLFVGFAGKREEGDTYVMVLFYDPAGDSKLHREAGSRDWKAAHAASASWLVYSLTKGIPASPDLTVDERDPEARVIVNPILDKEKKVVGVAGMIVDESYLKDHLLPSIIRDSLPQTFPGDHQDTVVNLRDAGGKLIAANRQSQVESDEVSVPLQFIFTDRQMGIAMAHMTEEQWAQSLFVFNLSLSILMTALLIGGIVMALKTASREMKLSQMKADFVSNVSHELRTPLASIRVFGEFLRLGRVREAEKIREYGEYIETESRRLTQLINNILDFSKIESGHKTYQFEEADVAEVIRETLRAFEVRLSQSGFNIIFDAPAQPLPQIVIDPDAIAQAFTNLLDNAVKYSGSSIEIAVRLGERDGYVTISVTDHGIGIAREERDKIFEKFYRVSKGLVHDVKGSGLGLSIVKHVVEAHKGKMSVEGKQGQGSTFTIYLPVGGAPGVDTQPQGPQPERGPDSAIGLDTVASDG